MVIDINDYRVAFSVFCSIQFVPSQSITITEFQGNDFLFWQNYNGMGVSFDRLSINNFLHMNAMEIKRGSPEMLLPEKPKVKNERSVRQPP